MLKEFCNKFSLFCCESEVSPFNSCFIVTLFSLDDFFVLFSHKVNRETFNTQDALDDNLLGTRIFLIKRAVIDQVSHS